MGKKVGHVLDVTYNLLIRRADAAGDGEDLVLAVEQFEDLHGVWMVANEFEIEGGDLALLDDGKFFDITQERETGISDPCGIYRSAIRHVDKEQFVGTQGIGAFFQRSHFIHLPIGADLQIISLGRIFDRNGDIHAG